MKINVVLPKDLKKEEEREKKLKRFQERRRAILINIIVFQFIYLISIGLIEHFVPSKIIRYVLENYVMGWYFICAYWFFCDAFHTMHLINKRMMEEIRKYGDQ